MPCNDVTELIQVTVDADDRLKHYTFSKRTCGQGVGAESLLIDILGGQSVDYILGLDAEGFLETYPLESTHPEDRDLEEFLSLKHFFAVQSALEVLTGKEPGRKGDLCAAAEISCDNGDLVIDAQIDVDIVTDRIKSCGNCGSCGAKTVRGKRAKKPAINV